MSAVGCNPSDGLTRDDDMQYETSTSPSSKTQLFVVAMNLKLI